MGFGICLMIKDSADRLTCWAELQDQSMGIPLASTIRQLKEKIQTGDYQNEAEISQGVVLCILSELGWPIFDTGVVVPEFGIVDGARKKEVDYALCHPPRKPAILIEVKDLGKANSQAKKQLFEYAFHQAFHQGVPIVVLTDGRIWNFFYPSGQGNYEDRRSAQIDLLDDNIDAAANKLIRYMNMEDVKSQLARKNAEEDYNKVRLEKSFESVWCKLSSKPEEVQLFLDEVKKETGGVRPNTEQAMHFLYNKARDKPMRTTSHAHNSAAVRKQQTGQSLPTYPSGTTPSPNQSSSSGIRESPKSSYCVDGESWHEEKNAITVMSKIVKWCARQHADGKDDYYEKLSRTNWRDDNDKSILSKKRTKKVEKIRYSSVKTDGWYVFNGLPNKQKKELIGIMLSVCIRSDGTSPILDQNLKVEMPNC